MREPGETGSTSDVGRRIELAMLWGGAVFILMFFIGLVPLAQWLPLPAANDSAAEVAAMYREDTDRLRAGLVFMFVGTMGFISFQAAIASVCRRITRAPAALRYVQIGTLGANIVFIILPMIVWFTAAYRPGERSPATLQLLNDLGWIMFLTAFVPFVSWIWAVGVTIFCDDAVSPVYPRWAGYLCLFFGTMQVPAVLLVFFKTGPFAWNNLMAWWVPATDFFGFMVVMLFLTARVLRAEAPERTVASGAGLAAGAT